MFPGRTAPNISRSRAAALTVPRRTRCSHLASSKPPLSPSHAVLGVPTSYGAAQPSLSRESRDSQRRALMHSNSACRWRLGLRPAYVERRVESPFGDRWNPRSKTRASTRQPGAPQRAQVRTPRPSWTPHRGAMLAGWVENTVHLEVRCWLAIAPLRQRRGLRVRRDAAHLITTDSITVRRCSGLLVIQGVGTTPATEPCHLAPEAHERHEHETGRVRRDRKPIRMLG